MNPSPARLLLPAAIMLAMSCGARSTLDLLEEQPSPGGGGAPPASGGRGGSGGAMMGTGGMTKGTGGMTTGVGGKTGGGGGIGGNAVGGSGGGGNAGGRIGGAGGRIAGAGGGTGGAGGRAGGAGGRIGGAGGGLGGQAGHGGSPPTGGRIGGAGGAAGGGAGGARPTGGNGGSGGVRATGGAGGTGASTCPGFSSDEDPIDDLNDGDRYIFPRNGRTGSWSVDHDGTPTGSMSPDPVSGFVPTATGDPCRKYAAYIKGLGFSDWGANLRFGLGSPYDASKYAGISFWARVDSGTKDVLRVAFPDKDTHQDGGICEMNTTGKTACFDHYGTRLTLSNTWTKHTIYFSALTQDGWGLQGEAFDPASLYEVLFQIPVNATFGIWIDDPAFVISPIVPPP